MPDDATAPGDQTLYYGDCLDWMRQWPDECVDLVYLDPPFNSNADYNIIFGQENGTPAQVRGFEDTWRWDEVAAQRSRDLESAVAHPMHQAATALRTLIGPSGMLAYLTYIGERLAEIRRLLKPTGSVYLHCDDTAVHYLKIVMDSIFGAPNFCNDIHWRRATAHSDSRRFGRISDNLLFYGKSDQRFWDGDAVREQRGLEDLRTAYPSEDERGRYRNDNLTGPRHRAQRGAPSTQPWRGYDVYEMGRVWSVPLTGDYAAYIEREFIPGYRQIEDIHQRLDALDEAGLIHHPESGRWPGLRRYAEADRGRLPQSIIWSPTGFTNFSSRRGEALGYPTQKPLSLLERLIKVSSRPGDFVLDPFCGCGTAVVAAHQLGRRWAGIDISSMAIDIVQERRLEALGIQASIQGIPQDLVSARRLASERWLDFQAWTVMRITGMAANESPGADAGIDGRGMLLNRPDDRNSRLAVAQVKGGRTFRLSELRDFIGVIQRDNAACGVFITVNRVTSRTARAEVAGLGEVTVGGVAHPRAQLWSIEEYFQGVRPNLPSLTNPYTVRPIEPTIFSQQRIV